jgi:hypothetical protein
VPELLETGQERELHVGDVLMVARWQRPRDKEPHISWRLFFVVTKPPIKGRTVVQARGTYIGYKDAREVNLRIYPAGSDAFNVIHYLPQEEWPDGVHAFRTALILQRKIDL